MRRSYGCRCVSSRARLHACWPSGTPALRAGGGTQHLGPGAVGADGVGGADQHLAGVASAASCHPHVAAPRGRNRLRPELTAPSACGNDLAASVTKSRRSRAPDRSRPGRPPHRGRSLRCVVVQSSAASRAAFSSSRRWCQSARCWSMSPMKRSPSGRAPTDAPSRWTTMYSTHISLSWPTPG